MACERAERRARFQRKAQLAARLTHPNIVPLHSYGERDGLSYDVMGYVRGESLADLADIVAPTDGHAATVGGGATIATRLDVP